MASDTSWLVDRVSAAFGDKLQGYYLSYIIIIITCLKKCDQWNKRGPNLSWSGISMNFHHSMTISPLPAPFGQTSEVRHWCAPVLGKAAGDHSHRSVTEKKSRCAKRETRCETGRLVGPHVTNGGKKDWQMGGKRWSKLKTHHWYIDHWFIEIHWISANDLMFFRILPTSPDFSNAEKQTCRYGKPFHPMATPLTAQVMAMRNAHGGWHCGHWEVLQTSAATWRNTFHEMPRCEPWSNGAGILTYKTGPFLGFFLCS